MATATFPSHNFFEKGKSNKGGISEQHGCLVSQESMADILPFSGTALQMV